MKIFLEMLSILATVVRIVYYNVNRIYLDTFRDTHNTVYFIIIMFGKTKLQIIGAAVFTVMMVLGNVASLASGQQQVLIVGGGNQFRDPNLPTCTGG